MKTIRISLTGSEWQMLQNYLHQVVKSAQINFGDVAGSMAQTLICEVYQKHLKYFAFIPNNKANITFNQAQGLAFIYCFKTVDDMVINKIRAFIHQKLV